MFMRNIIIDPTDREVTTCTVMQGDMVQVRESWPHTEEVAGGRLAETLMGLQVSARDSIEVVIGPGYATGVRIAATVVNVLHMDIPFRLAERRVDEAACREVSNITPVYADEVRITPARVH